MSADTPVARVAAYLKIATLPGSDRDILDTVLQPTPDRPRRHDLRIADLAAVLDALADACDDHQACAACGAQACETCGLGDLTDCDPPHCATDPWCWCEECRDAYRIDQAVEVGGQH